ncbi:MAG: redoxin domain-containing protein [Bacteroidota bacterium]|nr:redoxin domain-containing protein [Bacteroidota bacterium]
MQKIICFLILITVSSQGRTQTAPDFTFTDTDGTEWNLYTELGKGKTVLLDFFYVNCVPCQTFTPEIVQVNNDYGTGNGKLSIFGISDRDDNNKIKQFDQSLGVNYPSCGNQGGGDTITSLYMSWFSFVSWPTYAVVCPDKSIAWNLPKSAGLPEIRAAIDNCPDWTGITTARPHSDFLIYPLPAKEHFNIKAENTGLAEIFIYDASGKEVSTLKEDFSSGPIPVSLTALNSGIYILIIKTANEQAIFKIPVIK